MLITTINKLTANTTLFSSIHTHTHTRLTASTRVGRYQKGKTNLYFTEARDSEWQ